MEASTIHHYHGMMTWVRCFGYFLNGAWSAPLNQHGVIPVQCPILMRAYRSKYINIFKLLLTYKTGSTACWCLYPTNGVLLPEPRFILEPDINDYIL